VFKAIFCILAWHDCCNRDVYHDLQVAVVDAFVEAFVAFLKPWVEERLRLSRCPRPSLPGASLLEFKQRVVAHLVQLRGVAQQCVLCRDVLPLAPAPCVGGPT